MSTDFNIRPVGAPAPAAIAQAASPAVENAVATELPASQSVAVVDISGRARNDTPSAGESVSHQAVIDAAAASIVYQVVDDRTNLVVDQFPDEAVLRRRAYFHALDLARTAPTRMRATDVRA